MAEVEFASKTFFAQNFWNASLHENAITKV